MTDEFDTDSVPVSPHSELVPPSAPPSFAPEEILNEKRSAALGQLAKDENIEGYAQERQDQAEAIDEGIDLPHDRQNSWFRRASKALSDAANEARGVRPTSGQEQPQPTYIPDEYRPEPVRDEDYGRKTGVAAERVRAYFGPDVETKQNIIAWSEAMDPQSHVASWLIENESPVPGPMMSRLKDHPEEWRVIAELPARQRDIALATLQGNLMAEMNFAQRLAQQQQSWGQQHRMSHAPAPIRPPRGAANVPQDLRSLASRGESVDDYVKARQAMEKKRG
jgi:hypothetical protein